MVTKKPLTKEQTSKYNVTRKAKLAITNAKLKKIGMKRCDCGCGKDHPLDAFKKETSVYSKECQEKQNTARKARLDTRNAELLREETKKCQQCREEKPFGDFKEQDRVQCIACTEKNTKNNIETVAAIKEENVNRTDGQKTCTRCKNLQDSSEFTGTNYTCDTCLAKVATYYNDPQHKFKDCRRSAGASNIPFQLTYEQCHGLFHGDCHQCGRSVDQNGGTLNTIDRMNSAAAYTISNCMSYCWPCNLRKKTLDPITLAQRALHIQSILLGLEEFYPNAWEDRLPGRYSTYKSDAKSKNRTFELTMEMYTTLINTPCRRCHRLITTTNQSSIDQIVPGAGYVLGNMQALCSECNWMKGTLHDDDDIDHILRIAEHAAITIATTPDYIPTCLNSRVPNPFRQAKRKSELSRF